MQSRVKGNKPPRRRGRRRGPPASNAWYAFGPGEAPWPAAESGTLDRSHRPRGHLAGRCPRRNAARHARNAVGHAGTRSAATSCCAPATTGWSSATADGRRGAETTRRCASSGRERRAAARRGRRAWRANGGAPFSVPVRDRAVIPYVLTEDRRCRSSPSPSQCPASATPKSDAILDGVHPALVASGVPGNRSLPAHPRTRPRTICASTRAIRTLRNAARRRFRADRNPMVGRPQRQGQAQGARGHRRGARARIRDSIPSK